MMLVARFLAGEGDLRPTGCGSSTGIARDCCRLIRRTSFDVSTGKNMKSRHFEINTGRGCVFTEDLLQPVVHNVQRAMSPDVARDDQCSRKLTISDPALTLSLQWITKVALLIN